MANFQESLEVEFWTISLTTGTHVSSQDLTCRKRQKFILFLSDVFAVIYFYLFFR